MRQFFLGFLWVGAMACGEAGRDPPGSAPDAQATDGGPEGTDDAGAPDGGGPVEPGAGLELVARLAGLWSGPATRTPLGDFRMMNVDFRDASEQVLFGRVDVDEENALRFAFSLETHGGQTVLSYRNGGYFLGFSRDTRTILLDHDAQAGRYHFCHPQQGCDYLDAVFEFVSDDHLIFDVMVRGQPHVYWDARRLETRALPTRYVDGWVSQGPGDAPFPAMPNLQVTARWTQPLAAAAPVWVLLTTRGCNLGDCALSRQLRGTALAGATELVLNLEQVHGGAYQLLVVLDRNGNLEQTMAPGSGDGVSLPAPLQVQAMGTTESTAPIVYDLP